ncbi:MAG: DUF3488 domain-containing protein, partial [Ectopseudomonas oleovorans]
LRYRELAWLNQLRMSWENLNYGWQRWVLGYQGEQQLKLLQNWFGSLDWQRLALVLVGTGALLIGLLALWLLKPWQQRPDPQRQAFRKFERLLARHDVRREAGEGARSFALRAARQLPEQAEQIETFARCFEQQRYAGGPASRDALRQALSDLRRALPWRLSR